MQGHFWDRTPAGRMSLLAVFPGDRRGGEESMESTAKLTGTVRIGVVHGKVDGVFGLVGMIEAVGPED